MEFRLAKIFEYSADEPAKVEFCDFITEQQFTELNYAIHQIEEVIYLRNLLGFIKENDKELVIHLKQSADDLLNKSIVWNGVGRDDIELVFLKANSILLNYLSSIRTFLDHSEVYLNRKFGNTSNEFLEYKKLLSAFFDHSFAYRFFYKLRNYAQHIGLPLGNIKFETHYKRSPNIVNGELFILFDKNLLLLRYDGWGVVTEDLKSKNIEFDVMPLVFEMTHNLTEIERNIEIILKEQLLLSARFINNMAGHLQEKNCEIGLAYDFKLKENGDFESYTFLPIPFTAVNSLKSIL